MLQPGPTSDIKPPQLGGVASPGGLGIILADADAWWAVKPIGENSTAVADRLVGDPAVLGSVDGGEISQEGLRLQGSTGNYASTPDAAALGITGDIDITVFVADGFDTTPAATSMFVSKLDSVSTRSWYFGVDSSGSLLLQWSENGSTPKTKLTAGALPADANGFRVTLAVSGGVTAFYYTQNGGTSWSTMTPPSAAGATSIFDSTSPVVVGAYLAGANVLNGTVKSVIIKDGIDGTVVASPDFEAATTGTGDVTDDQGNVWTVTTTGVDFNDPLVLPHDGTDYVWLPGTASNSVTYPRPYSTTHITIIYTDDTTDTETQTSDPVVIGGTAHSGSVKSVELRETTAGGTLAETLDPSDLTGWTVNRSATGLKTAVVTRPVTMFDGTDDYLQLPASATPTFTATTGEHTVVVAWRQFSNATSDTLYNTESAADDGVFLLVTSSGTVIARTNAAGARKQAVSSAVTLGKLNVAAWIQDDGTVSVYTDENGIEGPTSTTALGTITHHTNPVIGARAYGLGSPSEMEFFDVIDMPGVALTEAELDSIAATLIAGAV